MAKTYLSNRIQKLTRVVGTNFWTKVAKQDDYALAMMTTSVLDEFLAFAIVIRSGRLTEKALFERVFKGDRATLSTFADKITIANLVGIVTDEVAADLRILKKIRNDFAHNELDKGRIFVDFSEKEISQNCQRLSLHTELTDEQNKLCGTAERKAFISSAVTIMIYIQVFIQIAAIRDRILEKYKAEVKDAMLAAKEKHKSGVVPDIETIVPIKSPGSVQ
jgi:hypothetical protein